MIPHLPTPPPPDEEWLAAHPEVRSVLQDFTTAVLADKPADVLQYAKDHFTRYYAAATAAAPRR